MGKQENVTKSLSEEPGLPHKPIPPCPALCPSQPGVQEKDQGCTQAAAPLEISLLLRQYIVFK